MAKKEFDESVSYWVQSDSGNQELPGGMLVLGLPADQAQRSARSKSETATANPPARCTTGKSCCSASQAADPGTIGVGDCRARILAARRIEGPRASHARRLNDLADEAGRAAVGQTLFAAAVQIAQLLG